MDKEAPMNYEKLDYVIAVAEEQNLTKATPCPRPW